jgi:hypothetical protein
MCKTQAEGQSWTTDQTQLARSFTRAPRCILAHSCICCASDIVARFKYDILVCIELRYGLTDLERPRSPRTQTRLVSQLSQQQRIGVHIVLLDHLSTLLSEGRVNLSSITGDQGRRRRGTCNRHGAHTTPSAGNTHTRTECVVSQMSSISYRLTKSSRCRLCREVGAALRRW